MVPTDRDLLACGMEDLEKLIDGSCEREGEIVFHHPDTYYWKRDADFFKSCNNAASCKGTCWSRKVQTILSKKYKGTPIRLKITFPEIPQHGGVCFGCLKA